MNPSDSAAVEANPLTRPSIISQNPLNTSRLEMAAEESTSKNQEGEIDTISKSEGPD